jgi:phosphoribosylanthranilate isomerase
MRRPENEAEKFGRLRGLMTWVKICGITNLEDAQIAVEAGADALGFVFYEKSPRNVAPETLRTIVREIPSHIEKIGVFVGNYPKNFLQLVHDSGLTGSQVHFVPHGQRVNETTAYGVPPGFKTYMSLPAEWFIESEESAIKFISSAAQGAQIVRSHLGQDAIPEFFQTIFLDSGSLQQPGGTGVTFDWQEAKPIVKRVKQIVKVVVAGGLSPANVTEAIHILKPWGVDVSSGVESKPGKKDPEKIRAFVTAVRQAQRFA